MNLVELVPGEPTTPEENGKLLLAEQNAQALELMSNALIKECHAEYDRSGALLGMPELQVELNKAHVITVDVNTKEIIDLLRAKGIEVPWEVEVTARVKAAMHDYGKQNPARTNPMDRVVMHPEDQLNDVKQILVDDYYFPPSFATYTARTLPSHGDMPFPRTEINTRIDAKVKALDQASELLYNQQLELEKQIKTTSEAEWAEIADQLGVSPQDAKANVIKDFEKVRQDALNAISASKPTPVNVESPYERRQRTGKPLEPGYRYSPAEELDSKILLMADFLAAGDLGASQTGGFDKILVAHISYGGYFWNQDAAQVAEGKVSCVLEAGFLSARNSTMKNIEAIEEFEEGKIVAKELGQKRLERIDAVADKLKTMEWETTKGVLTGFLGLQEKYTKRDVDGNILEVNNEGILQEIYNVTNELMATAS